MISSSFLFTSLAAAAAASASSLQSALGASTPSSASNPAVVDATYDGLCFYPKPTSKFVLDDYLGRWYQVAGTAFGPTVGCDCIFADYTINVSTNLIEFIEALTYKWLAHYCSRVGQWHRQSTERLCTQWKECYHPRRRCCNACLS